MPRYFAVSLTSPQQVGKWQLRGSYGETCLMDTGLYSVHNINYNELALQHCSVLLHFQSRLPVWVTVPLTAITYAVDAGFATAEAAAPCAINEPSWSHSSSLHWHVKEVYRKQLHTVALKRQPSPNSHHISFRQFCIFCRVAVDMKFPIHVHNYCSLATVPFNCLTITLSPSLI